MWFDAYCMWLPTTQKISSKPVVAKWLVSGNGGRHFNEHKKKIPGQIVNITDILLPEELWTVAYCLIVFCWSTL